MDYSDLTVVLPTLNEGKSIGILIKKLTGEYKGIRINVVDDGSTDDTMAIVKHAMKTNGRVKFLDRARGDREKGLTASVVDGILMSNTKFTVVMDADLQHPVEVIGTMAEKLRKGESIVVAVRADVEGWEFHRKLISKTLITLGRAILAVTAKSGSNDIFSGFFGVDTKFFARVFDANKNRFVGGGYKVLYDTLKCIRKGTVRIGEVPYSFGLRKYGKSKAGLKQGMLLFKSFIT